MTIFSFCGQRGNFALADGGAGWQDSWAGTTYPTQTTVKIKRILLGVAIGVATVAGVIVLLTQTLGNVQPTLVRGQSLDYWAAQVHAADAGASNQANALLNAEIIPQLTQVMFHDTNDSTARMTLVNALNALPGINILYAPAAERRAEATLGLGDFGPAGKAAIPSLLAALQGSDPEVHPNALKALGAIHSEPDVIIPLLTKYLADDRLDDEAAAALGNFGSLARAAIPKLIPLLQARDKDARDAATQALKKIDPATYANTTNPPAQ